MDARILVAIGCPLSDLLLSMLSLPSSVVSQCTVEKNEKHCNSSGDS
jgi:hypothetical protein